MKIPFVKMHAQGNDYLYLDAQESKLQLDFPRVSRTASERHYGIGSDGLVLIETSEIADAKMSIWNADGTFAQMCGSALRSVIAYLFQKTGKREFKIETASGIKTGMVVKDGNHPIVEVNMGYPELIDEDLVLQQVHGMHISMGNPHFVAWGTEHDFADKAASLSADPYFAEGVNAEFVSIQNRNEIQMWVWERGSGATLACGTGACASVFAGITSRLLDNQVTVHMPGGSVTVTYSPEKMSIYLKGTVHFIATGFFNLD